MYHVEDKIIKSFRDLNAWKEGHQLVLAVYSTTKNFPSDQRFALTNQIQRAVVSVTSNIAEGFSRKSDKEKLNFYFIARGSLTEVQNHLLIARDLGYTNNEDYDALEYKSVITSKLLNGLIKSLKLRAEKA